VACVRYDGTPTSDFFDLVGSLYLQVSGVQRLGVEAVRLLGDPTNALSRVIRKVTGGVLPSFPQSPVIRGESDEDAHRLCKY